MKGGAPEGDECLRARRRGNFFVFEKQKKFSVKLVEGGVEGLNFFFGKFFFFGNKNFCRGRLVEE